MALKNIYRWHRRLSLIIALPLVLSAGSGILHPIMTNIRPSMATQALPTVPMDSERVLLSIGAALDRVGIDSIYRARVIHIDTNWFYQVQRSPGDIPLYISARTGKVLPRGDWLYAQHLARLFLEGAPRDTAIAAKVKDEIRLTGFDDEYSEVNRVLPVYRVSFERPDGIRLYVETLQDRFAFAVDNRRASFNRVFEYVHTYQWLDFLGKGRLVAEFLFVFTAFLTTVLGVWIFFSTRSKKVKGNAYVSARRNHRYTAIVISLFTGMFTFSGAYHAIYKLRETDHYVAPARARFATGALNMSPGMLERAVGGAIAGFDPVWMSGQVYWQVTRARSGQKLVRKDLMADKQAPLEGLRYIPDGLLSGPANGDSLYAIDLAGRFSNRNAGDIVSVRPITRFDDKYNFADKLLPVWEVTYKDGVHPRYFVETSSGRLSVRADDWDIVEGYSFALLHKHEFLGWLGKPVKDFSTIFWALAQILLVALGLMLYFRSRQRSKK